MAIDFLSDSSLWFKAKGQDASSRLISLADAADDDNKPRRDRAAYNCSILEGLGIQGLGSWAYGRSSGGATIPNGKGTSPIIWNYAAAGLDTLQAKIAGRNEDKPMIMVTDGDWDDHRRAVWSGRLLDGLYSQDHGMYHNVWDLTRHAFKIAAGLTGSVAVKVVGYPGEDKLVAELHDTLDMFIDNFECSYSAPLTYGETTWYDPLRLMGSFDDRATKQMIWDCREPLPEERGGGQNGKARYMVKLVEGWRCTVGTEEGAYLAATKNGPLIQRKYNYSTPPFAFLHARRTLCGFYGIPVMERGMRIVERINQIVATLDKGERLLPRNMLFYDLKASPKEAMRNVRDVMQVGYSSDAGGHAPQYLTPQIYDNTVMALLERHIQAFYETLGINSNEMSAQKAPGVVAAVAIRTVADLMTELFSVISRDYEHFVTAGIGSLFLRESQELAKNNPKFAVSWKGNGSMKSIKMGMVDMKDKKFIFGVQPVSGVRDTPADRISLADEMLSRKELSPEAHARVVQTGDLPAELKVSQTQTDMVAQAIDSWLYDDLQDVSNISPLPWMNLPGAIVQCLDAYMAAMMNPKFDVSRELYFRRYISQCDAFLKRQALDKAQLSGAVPTTPQAAPLAPQLPQ